MKLGKLMYIYMYMVVVINIVCTSLHLSWFLNIVMGTEVTLQDRSMVKKTTHFSKLNHLVLESFRIFNGSMSLNSMKSLNISFQFKLNKKGYCY